MTSDFERELREIRERQERQAADATAHARREAEQTQQREMLADRRSREISSTIPPLVRPVLTSLGQVMWKERFEFSQDGLAISHHPRPGDWNMLLEYAFNLEFFPQYLGTLDDKFLRLSLWCGQGYMSEDEFREIKRFENEAQINFEPNWRHGTSESHSRYGVVFLGSKTNQLALENATKIAAIVGPYTRRAQNPRPRQGGQP